MFLFSIFNICMKIVVNIVFFNKILGNFLLVVCGINIYWGGGGVLVLVNISICLKIGL